jgi:hypothetical protein
MARQIYYISLSYATFGIVVDNNIVIAAPPIAQWMIGKHINEIIDWVNRKHGTINNLIL